MTAEKKMYVYHNDEYIMETARHRNSREFREYMENVNRINKIANLLKELHELLTKK